MLLSCFVKCSPVFNRITLLKDKVYEFTLETTNIYTNKVLHVRFIATFAVLKSKKISIMKKLFVLAFVATSFALVSCGSSETATSTADTAVVVADTTPVVAPADTTPVVVADTLVKTEVKK